MKIVVLMKVVPDTYGDRKLNVETGLADRGASEAVIDEIGERALEVALSFADKNKGVEVIVLSMAPGSASSTIRKGLAMGASSAVHVVDEGLAGADYGLTAEVLASVIRRGRADLVIAGNLSTDGVGGVVPAMVAEHLSLPHLTSLSSVDISDGTVAGARASDAGSMRVSASLPAVISITEALPDARFPNFKGIMAAKKKPFETLSLADLDVLAEGAVARSIMLSLAEKPPREAGMKIVDEGDAGEKLADFLIRNRLA